MVMWLNASPKSKFRKVSHFGNLEVGETERKVPSGYFNPPSCLDRFLAICTALFITFPNRLNAEHEAYIPKAVFPKKHPVCKS